MGADAPAVPNAREAFDNAGDRSAKVISEATGFTGKGSSPAQLIQRISGSFLGTGGGVDCGRPTMIGATGL